MFKSENARELTKDREFRSLCQVGGGSFQELPRAPGGRRDMGCKMPSGANLFVDDSDPVTGERPTNGSAFLTVESNGDVMSFGITHMSAQGDGPQRIDVDGVDVNATFIGEEI